MVSTRSKRTRSAKRDPDAAEGKEDVANKKSKKTDAMNITTVNEEEQKDNNTGENEPETVSSILEKGIIYFFFKGRVGVEEPRGIQDVARSYIVLRPISIDSKVETSSLDDSRHARLLVLPKKTLPKKHGRGFLAFVKTPASSLEDLREELSGGEYDTKTRGKRQVPAAKPFAEGMYAIISKDQRSHLVYRITFPAIGDVQKEFGVHERGSYIVSAKNPKFPSPGSVSLGEPPKYPEKIQKYFRDLRWVPLVPELLDYENTQLLIIGEGLGIMRQAAESRSDDEGDKQSFEEGTEELQNEDGFAQLEESDPTFTMLDSNLEDHLKMKTTW